MHRKGAGVNIPVFSLRSKQGLGTGEFLDLIPFIDWAKQAGLTLIQLLPINDTSIRSSSDESNHPYSILSAFALHPIYIHFNSIAPELEDQLHFLAKELNGPHLNYRKTFLAKNELWKKVFEIRGERDLASKDFTDFFKKHGETLKPYAAFNLLCDQYKTYDFRKWERFATYSPLLVEEVCRSSLVKFFYFVQFHLDKQLRQVKTYAKKKKILLKGDFPMGVHPNSVEAWRFSHYFRWHKSMGAPPDFYNDLGQNWGFPPYDWETIREEGYVFLKSRLQWMQEYFDLVRLDHVLGYFRLWEIPKDEVRGLLGTFFPSIPYSKKELQKAGITNADLLSQPHEKTLLKGLDTQLKVKEKISDAKMRDELYTLLEDRIFLKENENAYHPRVDLKKTKTFQSLAEKQQKIVLGLFTHYFLERQEDLWKKEGREKLKFILKNTTMLVCAEDIGVIPDCVQEVLKELQIPNLYVQRMPKNFALEYEDPKDFSKNSICTPSNHDTATIREWWEEDEESTKRYYQQILHHSGDPPKQCREEIAKEIIQAHLDSKSLYAIFLLQDLFAISDQIKFPVPKLERINDPADPKYCWRWRMHLYIEELLLAKSFSQALEDMIKRSKR